jgi:UDP-N-acetyl-D-mannosaminuronic acid dehydrogenase
MPQKGNENAPRFRRTVCVIGGAGHVGLPLAMTFADVGHQTLIYDINREAIAQIRRGQMPFVEDGGPEMLAGVLESHRLEVDDRPASMSDCEFLVMIVGTPVDEHLNPTFAGIQRALDGCIEHLRDGQVLILRSTVFPGISRHIQEYLGSKGLDIGVAFCPERVAQGHSLDEFRELPQIISAFDAKTLARVRRLFEPFTPAFVEMEPMEAELCKLMTNAWRYLQFAAVNQFYIIATERGLDFSRILHGCRYKYPRMAGMPGPGFAAGPCLVKDTMQLAAFSQNQFVLGHAAMLINEGLPSHLLNLARRKIDLSHATAAILGMAFKAESDDRRDSLSYKLRKLLALECKHVVCTDPYVRDPQLVPLEQAISQADVLFVGTPHKAYRSLAIPAGKIVIDVWDWVRPAEAEPSTEHQAPAAASPRRRRADRPRAA